MNSAPEKAPSIGKFIQRHNIAHYEELLKTEADPAKREILQGLLAEERRKAV
jgi:hypothetical protein